MNLLLLFYYTAGPVDWFCQLEPGNLSPLAIVVWCITTGLVVQEALQAQNKKKRGCQPQGISSVSVR